MRHRHVTFVGNCQALAMSQLYREFVGPAMGERVGYFNDHDVPLDQVRAGVAGADLLVVQDRDFNHGLTPDELPAGVRVVNFPMALAGFIWPFANEAHVHNVAQPPFSDGPYPSQLGDSYLNRLIRRGVRPEAALEEYLALDVARIAHLDRLFEIYMDKQQERDARTGFEVTPVVAATFTEQPLFRTPHHPNAMLFGVVARQLFDRLDVPGALTRAAVQSLHKSPFPSDELPVHPAVIRHFGLRYADDDTRYSYFDEGSFTFREWVLRYMGYENNHDLREAITRFGADDPADSVARLDRALARSPNSVRGWRFRGAALDRLNRPEEARAAYARAIELDPADAENHVAQSASLLRFGDAVAAEAEAARAVALTPLYAPGHQALGEARLRLGDGQGAVAALEAALQLSPCRADTLQWLGLALLHAGDTARAEEIVRRAIDYAPDRIDHRNLLAEVLEEQGRRVEAIALLMDGPRDAQSYSLLGNFHLRGGDAGRAADAFAEGVRLDPDRADLGHSLAQARELAAREAA